MNQVLRWLGLDAFTRIDRVTEFRFLTDSWLSREVFWALLVIGLLLACINFLPAIRMRRTVRATCFVLRIGMLALLLLALERVHLKLGVQTAREQSWLALVDDSGSMGTSDARGESRYRAAVADAEAVRQRVGRQVQVDMAALSGAPLPAEAGAKTATRIHEGLLRELTARSPLQRVLLLTDGRDASRTDFALTGAALKSRNVSLDIGLYGADKPNLDSRLHVSPERCVIRLGESVVMHGSLTDPSGKASAQLRLQEDGATVRTLSVPRESYKWFEVSHRPKKAGLYRYTLSMETKDAYRGNDSGSFFVDVRDEKINVLMIEGLPGYEYKLVKVALETDPLVHLVGVCHLPGGGVYVQGGPLHARPSEGIITSEPELFKYDIVILLDVPRSLFRTHNDPSESAMKLLVSFVQKRGGGLVVMGGQSVYRAGNYQDNSPLADILPFDLGDGVSKEPHFPGRFYVNVANGHSEHPLLRLLPDPDANRELWRKLPQLDGSNNVGLVKPIARPLLSRQVEVLLPNGLKESRETPILACVDLGEGKLLAAAVDTFWRWQLQSQFKTPPLETFMANVVRYLAPEPGARAGGVNVTPLDPTPVQGRTVVMASLLRDNSYEPVRGANLKVVVKKPDKQILTIYPCDLPESPGRYEYRFLADQAGDWEATAFLGKDKRTTKFVVRPPDDEYAELAVDRETMKALASAAGGSLVEDPVAWAGQADLRPVTDPGMRDLEVWNSPAVLVLFILLVCADCYVRKRQGLA